MKMLKNLAVCALTLASVEAVASPLAGTWQGPCETRGNLSVKFTYVISAPDAEGQGTIAKTKIYYDDASCSAYNHTGRQTVVYKLGDLIDDIYDLDVVHRGTVLYDIVTVSADGSVLTFGDRFSRYVESRPTTLSTADRVFVRVAP